MFGLKPESWAVIVVALFGIIAAVFAYARTPADKRNRLRPASVEERLAASPPGDKAVIIRADRRRAIKRDLPFLILLLPVAALVFWFDFHERIPCASLFGIGRERLALGLFFAIPPALVVVALFVCAQAVRGLRGGYWPPLDAAMYQDTLAISGPKARWRAIALLALLPVLLAVTGYNYVHVLGVFRVGNMWTKLQQAEHRCTPAPR